MYCPFGFQRDENGCEICKCNDKPPCTDLPEDDYDDYYHYDDDHLDDDHY
jgi:hypothetical protein